MFLKHSFSVFIEITLLYLGFTSGGGGVLNFELGTDMRPEAKFRPPP